MILVWGLSAVAEIPDSLGLHLQPPHPQKISGGEDKNKPAPAQRQIMPYPENDAVIQEFRRRFTDAGNPIPSLSQIPSAEIAVLARLTDREVANLMG